MGKRMFLQLFEDGGGAGSGGQGGNAGEGNGSQGNAGGSGNQGSYSFAQAEEIANARADRAEKAALRSYFQQQGMTEQQVNQAIADYKEQQKKNQPNVTQLQQDLENSRNEVQQMKNEKFLSGKGVKADDLDYVTYKVSKMVDDKTTFEKAAEKFLKENPRFAGGGSYRIADSSAGNASNGAGGNMNASGTDFIRCNPDLGIDECDYGKSTIAHFRRRKHHSNSGKQPGRTTSAVNSGSSTDDSDSG